MANLKTRQCSSGLEHRQLHVEHLEDRRLLAQLIGVDFDVTEGDSPLGWTRVSSSFREDEMSLTISESNIGGSNVDISLSTLFEADVKHVDVDENSLPSAGPPLPDLVGINGTLVVDGVTLDAVPNLHAIWSDLKIGQPYEVYVFGLDLVKPLTDPPAENDFVNSVRIQGAVDEFNFIQYGKGNRLHVNAKVGVQGTSLSDYAKIVYPNLNKQITVDVFATIFDSNDGSTSIAGLAIREAIEVNSQAATDDGEPDNESTSLVEAISIANATPGHDTLVCSQNLSGATITTGGTQKVITEGLTIDCSRLNSPVTIDAQGQSRIFDITTPAGQFVVLDSVNLTGGQTTGENADENDNTNSGGAIRYFQNDPLPPSPSGSTGDVGAGMAAATGGLHIRNSLITGNSTAGKFAYGGAVFADGPLFITDSIIRGNHTEGMYGNGGAIRANAGLTVTGSIIEDNFTMGPSADGGGINALGGATITDSTIHNNRTLGEFAGGGGITNRGFGSPRGTMTFTRSTISGNWTMGQFSSGAGIAANLDLTITDSNIFDNKTYGNNANGAAISSFGGDLTITGSSLYNNVTAGDGASGGAISVNGPLIVNSSTISGNSVGGANADGGAILSGVDVTLNQSTLFGNHATGTGARGGGIINFGGDVVLNGSIVAGNTATAEGPDLHPIVVFGATLTANYSLVGDINGETIGGTGSIVGDSQSTGPVNPLLGPLADNGGAKLTHLPLPASPAIDMGDPAFAAPPTYDQRGFAFDRVVNGRIDIGAMEVGATSADFDTSGSINGADFLIWQRGYGMMPVNHGDGDANLDGAVSDTDRALWSGSFGQSAVTPLVAPVVGSGYRRAGMMRGSAVLIDAAMALERIDSSAREEAIFVTEPATLESADAINVESAGLTLAASVSSDFDFVSSSSDQIEDHDEPWIAEALLERVFD